MAGALLGCGGGDPKGSVAIVGAGSTAQEVAQRNWIVEFERRRPKVEVTYDAVDSASGREQFIAGEADYAASDTPLEGAELRQAVARCEPGQPVEVPVYLSKITVAFHLDGLGFVNFTPETLARVFDRRITRWSDPEIRRENPPIANRLRGPITLVYPAGESGVTKNFTAYLTEAVPGVWRHGSSETWPATKGETPVDSPVAMLKEIKQREGSIGFIDASRSGSLKPVLIKTGKAPSDVSVPDHGSSVTILESSPEAKDLKASPYMLPFELDRPYGERGTYPLVLTSYLIACTRYDSAKEADAVREFFEYVLNFRGQEVAETEAGADQLVGELKSRAESAAWAIE